MQHITFDTSAQKPFKVAILIKGSALSQNMLLASYVEPIIARTGLKYSDFIAISLDYDAKNKASSGMIKNCVANITKVLPTLGVSTLLIADSTYYKAFTKDKNSKTAHGYSKPAAELADVNCVVIPNYQSIFYNPNLSALVDLGIDAVSQLLGNGSIVPLGADIIHSALYPNGTSEILAALQSLHQHPFLYCDIEAFSLNFWEAGIGTISFSWDSHNGLSFPVDYLSCELDEHGNYGIKTNNRVIKQALAEFFRTYTGKVIYHNGCYDIKVLIFELFMSSTFDNFDGMCVGLDTLTKNIHDTKLIAYLATNNAAKNELGLKTLAHSYTGNYAQDEINDIRKIPLNQLLKYNLIDCLATAWVFDTYYDRMILDKQSQVYYEIFLPSVPVIIQMELTGVPIDKAAAVKAQKQLETIRQEETNKLLGNPLVQKAQSIIRQNESDKKHEKWKTKKVPLSFFDYITFNPGSPNQLQILLYEVMGLPIIDKTDSGAPSTGKDTLIKLREFLDGTPESNQVIDSLLEIGQVSILLDNFIHTFIHKSVWHPILRSWFIHGNFNLGGTLSGRLSSNNPNLQNIPNTGNKYAELVKACIKAPKGWLLLGADFASLEDRISALTTKDPNKLKVYTDGFDGHCLRAAFYFREHMPDIDINDVQSVNSIAKKYPHYRQDSKAPTFALTYLGTWRTLVNNCGFTPQLAKSIETNYHIMYKHSDDWVQEKLKQASIDGYVTVAFGLRVRTPLLKQVVYGASKIPYEAVAEGRTAGNALGQSYGLLNNRAAIEFKSYLDKTNLRTEILPIMHIHDAQYMLVKNNIDHVKWVNDVLPECMKWQELPEIQHDVVKLGGEVDVFYPDWTVKYTIPNGATKQEIIDKCQIKP